AGQGGGAVAEEGRAGAGAGRGGVVRRARVAVVAEDGGVGRVHAARQRVAAVVGAGVAVVTVGRRPRDAPPGRGVAGLDAVARVTVVAADVRAEADAVRAHVVGRARVAVVARDGGVGRVHT